MGTLNRQEQEQVGRLFSDATTKLCKALEIAVKAQERVVNGAPDTTIQHNLRDAVEEIQKASSKVKA